MPESGCEMAGKKGMPRRLSKKAYHYLYMEVDTDDKDLPTGRWSESPLELAKLCGVTRSTVISCAWRVEHGKLEHGRFVRVKIR